MPISPERQDLHILLDRPRGASSGDAAGIDVGREVPLEGGVLERGGRHVEGRYDFGVNALPFDPVRYRCFVYVNEGDPAELSR